MSQKLDENLTIFSFEALDFCFLKFDVLDEMN